jgi:hypothetical protein
MLGDLVVTFCKRGSEQSTEIWAFPDDTLNVVVASEDLERSLPCSPVQLERVLEGQTARLRDDDTTIEISSHESEVCVNVDCGGKKWTQCIDSEEFRDAIALPSGF